MIQVIRRLDPLNKILNLSLINRKTNIERGEELIHCNDIQSDSTSD